MLNIVIQTLCASVYLLQIFSNATRIVYRVCTSCAHYCASELPGERIKIHGYLTITSRINFRGPLYTAELCLDCSTVANWNNSNREGGSKRDTNIRNKFAFTTAQPSAHASSYRSHSTPVAGSLPCTFPLTSPFRLSRREDR